MLYILQHQQKNGRYFTLLWVLELASCSETISFQAIAALFGSKEEDLHPTKLIIKELQLHVTDASAQRMRRWKEKAWLAQFLQLQNQETTEQSQRTTNLWKTQSHVFLRKLATSLRGIRQNGMLMLTTPTTMAQLVQIHRTRKSK